MKFGFIAHPTSPALKRHVKMVDLLGHATREAEHGPAEGSAPQRLLVPFADFGRIRSASGASCEGVLQYLPMTAEEMLGQPRLVAERVVAAAAELAHAGAQLVGLGGFTGIVGQRGLNTLEKAGVPVTTGNSLTAFASWQNVLQVLALLDLAPERQEVAVVGYPGSIALVVAKLLARAGCRLLLVHRRGAASPLQYLPLELHAQVRTSDDVAACYEQACVIVAATSSGGLIDPRRLAPGSVVIDAALPRDVMPVAHGRHDIVVLDGGLVSADDAFMLGADTMGLTPKKMMNGCLAETMVLALERRAEAFSIGRELPEDKVVEIGRLAARHGIEPGRLASYGERVRDADLRALRRFHGGSHRAAAAPQPHDAGVVDKDEVLRCFGEHVNPVMREFFELNHVDRVFVRGQGCTLVDERGREFLDFVAGYGCLNMGHNHPRTVGALRRYLDSGAPTFVQYVSAPAHTSRLAERLAQIAPGALSRVFFSNSGTEAVEAAIKLARAATGRPRLLYCDNGYHGKTLGALSLTGRDKHRAPFAPLLPHCDSIPFADIAALRRELERGDVGAFIVEPIQGEGGVIVPPEGYLRAVREACDQHGCILILDEIQTGLGRTGKLFACEWEQVEPDILVLAKSLSGGLVPIGATLARAPLWDRAYGSRDRFSLHSSTFGGGNLAAAVALETLDLLHDEDLAGRALAVGAALKGGLQEVARAHPFIKEVRGRGLMIAIEFDTSFAGAVTAFAREFAGRFPGDALRMHRFLSDKARAHLAAAAEEVERSLEEMFVLRIVTRLSQDHGILTFVTANNSRVMRIQPPLTLSDAQALRFVECFAKVCAQVGAVGE
ncbi:MAG TPA: aminotransferase class III-fold pyridoxal phosphate-dependent enzyme [Albitalea sp.]|nr:aminotransferase class III-fold pyridoxal phosphate-dependent enzyme [Albitalea sp.]